MAKIIINYQIWEVSGRIKVKNSEKLCHSERSEESFCLGFLLRWKDKGKFKADSSCRRNDRAFFELVFLL